MSWLDCEVSGAKITTKLACKACKKFESKSPGKL